MMKRIAQACGFAAILLLPNYIDLTSSTGDSRMRFPVPLTKIALAQLVDLLIAALVFAGLMAILRQLKKWPAIRWTLMALLPPFLFVRNLNVFPFEVPNAVVAVLSLIWMASVVLLILRVPSLATKLGRAGSAVLAGFAIFAMVITGQLIRAALWKPGPQAFAATIPAQPASRPRLVWILFDELAYQPTFESRDSSLHLPNLDRLRRESTLYTDMTPIAYRTTRVVPSLLLGQTVSDVEYTSSNRYLVQIDNSSQWTDFDVNASLFGQAKQLGVTTAIVGWYVAYCPIFAGVATQCYWSNDDAQDRGPTSLDASFAENVWFPLRVLVEQFVDPGKAWADQAEWNAEGHIASVKDVSQHALSTLASSQADVIYLHLPAPHPPSFWNRSTGTFAVGGSYLDSLDYSDRLLGQMLDLLETQPRWAATTLLVQGDHSWRTQMWRPLPGWSAEDERISHGGAWDPRPVLLIHTPGQNSPATVSAPTSVMYIHDFVAGQIKAMAK
jgi:arylsulfatase A-like enzyme